MNDDQSTRVIKRTVTETIDADVTKVIGGNVSDPVASEQSEAAGEQTRVHSGRQRSADSGISDRTYDLTAGWLVIVEGPGRGVSLEIYFGMNSVGRAPNQRIPLDFGDEAISRESHAFVVYDEMQHDFYIQHGGKANLVRHNNKPVLSPVELNRGDIIDIGSTKLMFVPLCTSDFNWSKSDKT
ncbi:MAG: FHA domain-containing protein [Rhodobacteraceae bacterium]|nr:FHA domain-containing protein [Paracoccaceae bacterium]